MSLGCGFTGRLLRKQLVRLARQRLAGVPRQMADQEDVALSAFKSFCNAAEQGRFPDLHDREGLWRLLFKMTARKAIDLRRHVNCERRGGGQVQNQLIGPASGDLSLDLLSLIALLKQPAASCGR